MKTEAQLHIDELLGRKAHYVQTSLRELDRLFWDAKFTNYCDTKEEGIAVAVEALKEDFENFIDEYHELLAALGVEFDTDEKQNAC